MYNTSNYVEHWQKMKKEEIPQEAKIDVEKFMCFISRRRLASIFYFTSYLSAPPRMTINFSCINNRIRIPLLPFICCLLFKITTNESKRQNVADDKDQIINNNSMNLAMIQRSFSV